MDKCNRTICCLFDFYSAETYRKASRSTRRSAEYGVCGRDHSGRHRRRRGGGAVGIPPALRQPAVRYPTDTETSDLCIDFPPPFALQRRRVVRRHGALAVYCGQPAPGLLGGAAGPRNRRCALDPRHGRPRRSKPRRRRPAALAALARCGPPRRLQLHHLRPRTRVPRPDRPPTRWRGPRRGERRPGGAQQVRHDARLLRRPGPTPRQRTPQVPSPHGHRRRPAFSLSARRRGDARGGAGRYVALLYRQAEAYGGGVGERGLDAARAKFDLQALGLGLPAGVRYFVAQR